MAPVAMVFGVLMTLLGVGLYGVSVLRDTPSADPEAVSIYVKALTALIPAAFGVVLFVLGWFAQDASDRARMHLMHVAAVLGLLGVALPAWRVVVALNAATPINPLAVGGNVTFIALSAIFLGLCIKSFIDARMARQQNEEAQPKPEG
ncbi:MAG: hypothetical protein FJ303_03805 [Planctomycetes bacterium]|nr:hypothetical protein [Planctomycetota bacterium]